MNKIKYFVAYQAYRENMAGNNLPFSGRCEVTRCKIVRNFKNIEEMEKAIEDNNPDLSNVSIMNWSRFE